MKKLPEDARLGGPRRKGLLPKSPSERKDRKAASIAFNLLVAGFLVYGFYRYLQQGGEAGVLNDLGEQMAGIDAERNGDPRIDRLQNQPRINALTQLFPLELPAVRTEVLKEGKGEPALCGQLASYRLLVGYGELVQKTSPSKTLRLGSPQVPQGLTLGMEGMKPGEVRRLSIPQQLWDGSQPAEGQAAEIIPLTVELQKLEPAIPESAMPLRRFTRRGSTGASLRCGDLAILNMTIWGGDGQKLFSTEGGDPVYFNLGDGTVPFGLERGVEEMVPGGQYSLVMSSGLWQPLAAQETSSTAAEELYAAQPFPHDLAVPPGQMVLVDVDYPVEAPRKVLPAAAEPVSEPADANAKTE